MNSFLALIRSGHLCLIGFCFFLVLVGKSVLAGESETANHAILKEAKQAYQGNKLKRSIKLYDSARQFYKTKDEPEHFLSASYELLQGILMLNYTPSIKFESVWEEFDEAANTYKDGKSIFKVRALHLKAKHRIRQAKKKNEYQAALTFIKQAEEKLKALPGSYPGDRVRIYLTYGELYRALEGGSKGYREKAFEFMKREGVSNPEVLARCYPKYGYYVGATHKRDSAIRIYREGIKILQKSYPRYHFHFYNFYNGIGRQYLLKTMNKTAMPYLDTAFQVLKASNRLNTEKAANLQIKFGYLAGNESRLYKSLSHYKRACRLLKSRKSRYTTKMLRAYNALSTGHYQLNELRKAKKYARKASGIIRENPELPKLLPFKAMTYGTFGNIYKKENAYDKAEKFYKKAIHTAKALPGKFYQMLAGINTNLSGNFIKQKQYDQAIATTMSTKNYFEQYANEKSSYMGNVIYYRLAKIYEKKGDVDSAFHYLNKATQLNTVNFQKAFSNHNPELHKVRNYFYQYRMAALKSSLYRHQYEKNQEVLQLQKALEHYQYAAQCLDETLKNTVTGKGTKFSAKKFDLLSPVIKVCHQLARETNQDKDEVLRQAYHFAEKTRALVMSATIAKYDLDEADYIPEGIIRKIKALNQKIDHFTDSIKNAKTQASKTEYETRKLSLYRDKKQIYDTLEAKYPRYFNQKFSQAVTPLNRVKAQLKKGGKNIVEYVVDDGFAYALVIRPGSTKLVELPLTDTLEQSIKVFRKGLSKDRPQFKANQAYKFYKHLFQPVEKHLTSSNVVVIPDGSIWYLPFDMLLQKSPEGNHYAEYPFLIRDYAFSYAPSTSLWMYPDKEEMTKNLDGSKKLTFSGYAPDFEGKVDQLSSVSRSSDTFMKKLGKIPGAKEELTFSASNWNAKTFMNEEATEQQFKSMATNSQIIHLATHGVINDHNPAYSKLLFSDGKESEEDGELHNYEIYNMELNADLAVLSACRTGYGKFMEGEGVMSLARGFKIAGCKNIIMTLWPVADRSSSELMQLFYKHLGKGLSKQEALRQAKLSYLESSDNIAANPFYWSGFVMMGSRHDVPEPSSDAGGRWWFFATGGFIILVFLSFYWLRRGR